MKVFRGVSTVVICALFGFSMLALAQQDQSKPEHNHKPPAHETKPAKAPPMAKPQHEHAQHEARHAQQQQEKQAQEQSRRAQAQEKSRAEEQAKQAQRAQENQARHQQEQQQKRARSQQEQQQKQAREQQKREQKQAQAQHEQQQRQAEENAKQAQKENARRAENRSQHARNGERREIAQERGPIQEVDRSHHGSHGRPDREARIPHDRFREHFGREHRFIIRRPVIIENEPRFEYSGYWFEMLDPWPAAWSYDDDCYIGYVDDGYYLFDPLHPGIRIAIVIVN